MKLEWMHLLALGVMAIMNGYAFALYAMDKRRAARGLRRISERQLLAVTLLMGGIGAFAASRLFRHKTQKRPFTLLIPLALMATLTVLVLLLLDAFQVLSIHAHSFGETLARSYFTW